MVYQKQTWRDLPNTSTPITAARLNHLETQYDESAILTETRFEDSKVYTDQQVASVTPSVGSVNLFEFGAVGDGITDDGPAIQEALNQPLPVQIPPGVFVTNQELKVPSGTILYGSGMESSTILGGPLLDRGWNVITNASNNREYRVNYDEYIQLRDFSVDGNYDNRPTGGVAWEGNASGIYLSTVRFAIVERVKVWDTPLHCFAVDASRLAKPEETPDFMVPGPSQHVVLRDCIAFDSAVDDGFTTHYSSDILIESCQAIRTKPISTGSGIQNGFEIDEGSFRVTVRDCYAEGWVYGVQIKGHDVTRPPWDVYIEDVTTVGCQNGLLASGAAANTTPSIAGKAANIQVRNLTCVSPIDHGEAQTVPLAAVKIFSYRGVYIDGLVSRNSPHGGVLIDKSGDITIRNVYGEDVWNDPAYTNSDGFIRTAGGTGENITVDSVRILNPVSGSVFRNNQTESVRMRVSNLKATAASGSNVPLISDSYLTPYRHYTELQGTGFSKAIEARGGSGAGNNCLSYSESSRGAGSPEGAVVAWPGYTYQSTNAASSSGLWVKNSGTGATGWKAL